MEEVGHVNYAVLNEGMVSNTHIRCGQHGLKNQNVLDWNPELWRTKGKWVSPLENRIEVFQRASTPSMVEDLHKVDPVVFQNQYRLVAPKHLPIFLFMAGSVYMVILSLSQFCALYVEVEEGNCLFNSQTVN